MTIKHGPAPWRREVTAGANYRIVDAKGDTVCFLNHPETLEQHANLRALLKTPELLARLKSLAMLLRAATMSRGVNPALVKAEELVASIEKVEPPPKPPEKERL